MEVLLYLAAGNLAGHLHGGFAPEHGAHLLGVIGMVLTLAGVIHALAIQPAARRPQPEVSTMPIGDFVNQIPAPIFLLIHLTAFAIGAYFAWRTFGAGAPLLGWAFALFALAEISYMTYHLDWTVFLFAHTISEVLDLSPSSWSSAATSAARFRRAQPDPARRRVSGALVSLLLVAGAAAAAIRRQWRPTRSTCRPPTVRAGEHHVAAGTK